MKLKFFFLFLLIFALSFAAETGKNKAQTSKETSYVRYYKRKPLRVGVFGAGGGSFASSSDMNANMENKFSFALGGLAERPFGKNIFLRLEILFARKGFRARRQELIASMGEVANITNDIVLNYLEFPFLFYYGTDRRETSRFYGFGGLQFSYLVSASYVSNSSLGGGSQGDLSQIDNYDFGLILGVGADLKEEYFCELRYDYGIKDIYVNSENAFLEGKTFHNQTVWLTFGYKPWFWETNFLDFDFLK